MLKKNTNFRFLFFLFIIVVTILLSNKPHCHGEEYSATWDNVNFKIFNLNILGNHVEAVFSVSFGSKGEVLFSLEQVNAPSETKESSYSNDNIITTPNANLGTEKTYNLKLQYKPEMSTTAVVFILSDWFINDQSVFGVAFNAMDGFGDWKESLQETSSFSKIAMIASSGTDPAEIAIADSEKINQAVTLKMKPLVVLVNIFFDENCSLYKDCEERFQTYLKNIKNSLQVY